MEEVQVPEPKGPLRRKQAQLGLDSDVAQSDDNSYFHVKYGSYT